MNSLFFVSFAVVGGVALVRGGPVETAIVAAMRLSEQPSYSWRSTVSDDARVYDLEGKKDRSGYTWMRLPMVKEFARRLGRDAGTELEAVFRSSTAYVVRTERGWQTIHELPRRTWDWSNDYDPWASPGVTRANLGAAALAGLDPWGHASFPPMVLAPALPADEEQERPYCNAQFGLSEPHAELAVIVGSFTAMSVEGHVASGTLSDLGAQLLLVREAQDHVQPLVAAGVFKLYLQGGLVTRYDLRLEGILHVDRRRVHVRQQSSTRISRIGATTVEVPDEARRKLEP